MFLNKTSQIAWYCSFRWGWRLRLPIQSSCTSHQTIQRILRFHGYDGLPPSLSIGHTAGRQNVSIKMPETCLWDFHPVLTTLMAATHPWQTLPNRLQDHGGVAPNCDEDELGSWLANGPAWVFHDGLYDHVNCYMCFLSPCVTEKILAYSCVFLRKLLVFLRELLAFLRILADHFLGL